MVEKHQEQWIGNKQALELTIVACGGQTGSNSSLRETSTVAETTRTWITVDGWRTYCTSKSWMPGSAADCTDAGVSNTFGSARAATVLCKP